MGKFVSITRIQRAIINLPIWRSYVDSQGATHLWQFLSLKRKNVNDKDMTPLSEGDDKEFFDVFTRVQDTKNPYYDALDESFRIDTHAHSNVATARKKTFSAVWRAARYEEREGQEYWQLSSDYLDIIQTKVLSKAGETHPVPLFDLLAWLYHAREFPDDIDLRGLVNLFREEFHINDKEFSTIFSLEPFDEIPEKEKEFFVDHPVTPDLLLELLEKKGDFDVADALEMKTAGDPQSVKLEDAVKLAREGRKQLILQGSPGTSKTYMARQIAASLLGADSETVENSEKISSFLADRQFSSLMENSGNTSSTNEDLINAINKVGGSWDIIQFHPSYTYEDFVRGITAKLTENEGTPTFTVENRIFGLLADVSNKTDKPIILIIDEINRGDLSKVLGELVYALEYRGESVRAPYIADNSSLISVGHSFYLLATMNTADRSIALIDYAIRRRFDFVDLFPDRSVLQNHIYNANLKQYENRILELYDTVAELFTTQRDFSVGHTYFMGKSTADIAQRVIFQVLPLLAEYQKERILDEHLTLKLKGWAGKSGLPINHSKPFEMAKYLEDWLEGGAENSEVETGEYDANDERKEEEAQ